MTATITVPPATLNETAHQFSASIPAGLSSLVIDMERASLNAHGNQGVIVLSEISYDSGATWLPLSSVTQPGGLVRDEAGHPVTRMAISETFHHPESSTRSARLTITPVGGSFTTSGGTFTVS